jgi:crotonobetainyl-CoA:carnitine CoA-transferase CaiB-like acyl-CoA transferase
MGITGFPDGEPTKVGVAIADMVCGLQAAMAVLAALYQRNDTDKGARIEVSLFESQLSWLANRAQSYLVSGEDAGRLGNAHPSVVPYQTFDASDKKIALAVGNDAQFKNLCRAIGSPELSEDQRFASNPDRVANREELVALLQEEFSKKTADEWVEEIRGAGVPVGPVNSLADVFSDGHVISSGILQNVEHPAAGMLELLASPVLVDGERLPIRRPPPTLGQHTDEMEGWTLSR